MSVGHHRGEVAGGPLVMQLAPTINDAASSSGVTPSQLPVLYASVVTHTRRVPIRNRFRYKASYWLVDYDHLPEPTGLVSRLVRFERSDHSDVRALLTEHGMTADRILMFAMPRTLGYVFNPISVFWCYDAAGIRVAVLAEVHNTYGERHTYLLRPDENGRSKVDKELYVSPFYPVDGHYDIRVSEPGSSISVSVTLHRAGGVPFVASLRGERRVASRRDVLRSSLLHPAIRIAFLIRWQAVRLWAARSQGAAAMRVDSPESERLAVVDLRRWAALAPPKSAPIRAALARRFLRRVATQTGIRVEFPDGTSFWSRRWSGHGAVTSREFLRTAGCGRQDRLRRVIHGRGMGLRRTR